MKKNHHIELLQEDHLTPKGDMVRFMNFDSLWQEYQKNKVEEISFYEGLLKTIDFRLIRRASRTA